MEIVGADEIRGVYYCSQCGSSVAGLRTDVIGIFEQKSGYGEIRLCRKCGNVMQTFYEKRGHQHAG